MGATEPSGTNGRTRPTLGYTGLRGNSESFMDEANELQGQESIASSPSTIEKKFDQAELDRIVKREKAAAEERYRREYEAQYKAELDKLKTGQSQNVGGMTETGINPDQLYQQFAQKFHSEMQAERERQEREQQEQKMQEIASEYFSKLKNGKEKYADFEEVVGDFQHDAFPQLVYAVAEMPNAADILYELNKNPAKLEQIDFWLNRSPKQGLKMLKNLANSITQNETAASEYEPINPPLSQPKASNLGTSSGKMSLAELKNAPWLKF